MNRIYLSPDELKILRSIFAGTYQVIIFGSRAKGTHKKFSDIDICLKAPQAIPRKVIALLKARCSESNLPYKVDILDYHDLDESFRAIVDTTGIPLT